MIEIKKEIEKNQRTLYKGLGAMVLYPDWISGHFFIGRDKELINELLSIVFPFCYRGLCFNFLSHQDKKINNYFRVFLEVLFSSSSHFQFSYGDNNETIDIDEYCFKKNLKDELKSLEISKVISEILTTVLNTFISEYENLNKTKEPDCLNQRIEFCKISTIMSNDINQFDAMEYILIQERYLQKINSWLDNSNNKSLFKKDSEITEIFNRTKHSLNYAALVDIMKILVFEKDLELDISKNIKTHLEICLKIMGTNGSTDRFSQSKLNKLKMSFSIIKEFRDIPLIESIVKKYNILKNNFSEIPARS